MRSIFGFIAAVIGIYSILIFIRIIFSWFGNLVSGRPIEILEKITDPYLDWFRRNLNLRIGLLDFSAVVAIVFLSLAQSLFYTLARAEVVSVGGIIAAILGALWTIISFIIGFYLIVIALRAFAYFTNRNIYSPFWQTVDNIYQPFMYRINSIIFGKTIGHFLKRMIIVFLLLLLLMIGGRFLINLLIIFLSDKFII